MALNTGSNIVTPDAATETFTFDQQLTVPKGTVKTLTLKCNVASNASGSFTWGITSGQITSISTTGATSGADITETGSTATGQTMTINTGSFAVSVDPSTSNYSVVAAGTTGVTIGTFKFRATNESVNLTKVGLVLSTSTASDVSTVSLWANGSQIGTATFTGSNTVATSTLNSALTLAKDTDVLITIKADLANVGTSQSGTEGTLVKIDVTNAEGTGVSSGSTLRVGSVTAGVNGVRMFRSFPTVAQDTLPTNGVSDGKLMRFKVTASSAGPVGLYRTNFTIATSSFATGGGVTAIKLNVYSDSSYSQQVSGSYGDSTGQFGSTVTPSSSNPSFDITAASNPLQIPAGATYYFELKGTVASTQDGASVTTTLNGDAAYISDAFTGIYFVASTTGADNDSNDDFIWSGNATSTATFSSVDWANGYGIQGLPADGFSQTRGN